MDSLGNLLLNYKIPGVRDAQVRHVCAQELTKLTGCTVAPSKLNYKQEILYLRLPPVLKAAIFMKQTELTECLKTKGILLKGLK